MKQLPTPAVFLPSEHIRYVPKRECKRSGTTVYKPHHAGMQKQLDHELHDLQEAESRSNYLMLSRKA